MGRRYAPVQEFWYGSKALKIGRDSGLTGAERCSDRHRLEEVSHVDALVAHSLGAAFGIEKEVGTSRLGHRRRDPGLRTRDSRFTGSRASRESESFRALPVLQIARGTISRDACGVISL